MEIPQQTDPFVPILNCPLVPIESDPHVLMLESILECSQELFFISTTCLFSSDEERRIRGLIRRRMRGSILRGFSRKALDFAMFGFWVGVDLGDNDS